MNRMVLGVCRSRFTVIGNCQETDGIPWPERRSVASLSSRQIAPHPIVGPDLQPPSLTYYLAITLVVRMQAYDNCFLVRKDQNYSKEGSILEQREPRV